MYTGISASGVDERQVIDRTSARRAGGSVTVDGVTYECPWKQATADRHGTWTREETCRRFLPSAWHIFTLRS